MFHKSALMCIDAIDIHKPAFHRQDLDTSDIDSSELRFFQHFHMIEQLLEFIFSSVSPLNIIFFWFL